MMSGTAVIFIKSIEESEAERFIITNKKQKIIIYTNLVYTTDFILWVFTMYII